MVGLGSCSWMKGQLCSVQDATTKVSVEVLQRVYTSLQDDDVVGSPEDGLAYKDGLNLEAHLWFIDSYEMPRWHWSSERGTFERYAFSMFLLFNGGTNISEHLQHSRFPGLRNQELPL